MSSMRSSLYVERGNLRVQIGWQIFLDPDKPGCIKMRNPELILETCTCPGPVPVLGEPVCPEPGSRYLLILILIF